MCRFVWSMDSLARVLARGSRPQRLGQITRRAQHEHNQESNVTNGSHDDYVMGFHSINSGVFIVIKLNAIWRKTVTELLVRSNTKPTKHRWTSPIMTLKDIQTESIYNDDLTAMDDRILYRISRIMGLRPYAMLYKVYRTEYISRRPATRKPERTRAVAREYPAWAYAPNTISSVDDWLSPKPAKPKSLAQDRQAALTKTLRK